MIPRLVRFYGGNPMRWLAELPMVVVKACHRMIAPLSAEESLVTFQRVAVGTGSFKEQVSHAVLAGWRTQADMPAADARPPREYPTADDLRAKGLKVFGPKPKAPRVAEGGAPA